MHICLIICICIFLFAYAYFYLHMLFCSCICIICAYALYAMSLPYLSHGAEVWQLKNKFILKCGIIFGCIGRLVTCSVLRQKYYAYSCLKESIFIDLGYNLYFMFTLFKFLRNLHKVANTRSNLLLNNLISNYLIV